MRIYQHMAGAGLLHVCIAGYTPYTSAGLEGKDACSARSSSRSYASEPAPKAQLAGNMLGRHGNRGTHAGWDGV